MASKKKKTSLWEDLNKPVAYPTEEIVKPFIAIVAAVILFSWAMPYFGLDNAIYRTAHLDSPTSYQLQVSSYAGLFDPYEAAAYSFEVPRVAGARVEAGGEEVIEIFNSIAASVDSINYIYEEAFEKPFAEAINEVLDISEEVIPIIEFYEPGVRAAVDAWLELMADPVL